MYQFDADPPTHLSRACSGGGNHVVVGDPAAATGRDGESETRSWQPLDGDEEFWDTVDGPPEPAWALAASEEVERELLAAAGSGLPGERSAAILQRRCPDGREGRGTAGLDAVGLLDGIGGLQRLIGWAQATQQRYIAALARPGVVLPVEDLIDVAASPLGIARDVPDLPAAALLQDATWGPALREAAVKIASVEIGCVLQVAPVTARSRTERAVEMVDFLPGTLAAQQRGDLDGYRASIIAERTAVLEPAQRRLVEDSVLPIAGGRTPARVRELVDRHVDRADPSAAARREQRARRNRGVRVEAWQDGMSSLRADLPAVDAQITYQVLDAMAATVQAAGLANGRGRGQLRADIFADLFRDLATHGRAFTDANETDRSSAGETLRTRTHVTDSNAGETDRAGAERTDAHDTGEPHVDTYDTDSDDTDTGETHRETLGEGGGVAPGASGSEAPGASGSVAVGASASVLLGDADCDEGSLRAAPDNRSRSALPVCVNVYVSASTLAGWDDEPGELAGCGVISAEFARALAESAATIRAIVASPVHAEDSGAGHSDPGQSDPGQSDARHPDPVTFDPGPLDPRPPDNGPRNNGPRTSAPRNNGPRTSRPRNIGPTPAAPLQPGPSGAPLLGADSSATETAGRRLMADPRESRPRWTDTGHSTDPIRSRTCGTVLDAGRAVYRPGPAATEFVTVRDRICTFAGCRTRASRCDLDHRLPFQRGGATCPCNLDNLCRFHHLVKTFTCWSATPGAADGLVWTAPTGRQYPTEPGHLLLDGATSATSGSAATTCRPDAGSLPAAGGAHPPVRAAGRGSTTDDAGQYTDPDDDPPPF